MMKLKLSFICLLLAACTTHHEPVICDGSTVKHCEPSVYFDSDSATLSEAEQAKLDWAADKLNRWSKRTAVISGYADTKGTDEYNVSLSEKRAQAVADYLKEKGVDAERITIKAEGKSSPVSEIEEEQWKNRRTTISINWK